MGDGALNIINYFSWNSPESAKYPYEYSLVVVNEMPHMFHLAVGGATRRCGRPAVSMVFDGVLSSERRFSVVIHDGFLSDPFCFNMFQSMFFDVFSLSHVFNSRIIEKGRKA